MINIKNIETQMVYLGLIEKIAKSGNKYSIAKFVHDESQEVYEFFVSNDVVKEKAEKCLKYLPAAVTLELSSYQGSTRVDLRDVKQSK
ncbi:hypothetical protein [Dehalobacter restrictus]|uniref:Uncharacterized protein n=1 Tax=Dehalobacter restrictus TaxID=55583 RepID=A0A857DJ98_9FIRM|nr:hypothetical protein [Dehalobacter restrictus]QHA00539.1 hypothetical protein GQ588_07795 [Dehalobacter restrictus]